MKKLALIILGITLFQIPLIFAQSGESQFKEISLSGKKNKPPVINITANFFDVNGNQALDANETAKIVINIKNEGQSDASDLTITVTEKNSITGLTIGKFDSSLGSLSPSSEKNLDVEISGAENLAPGSASFAINVKEADGFDADPVNLQVLTRELASPQLAIVDHAFTTELGGKVVLGKTVDLNLVIQNNGDGKAENVTVKFTNPPEVFPGSNTEFTFINIDPGDKKLVTYTFLPNERYTASEVNITAVATEKSGAAGASKTISVALDEELVSSSRLIAENDGELIYRGGGDPLKGLNSADAKKEMQLGDYYALIIGVDGYTGAWAPLENAVKDAKGVENLLKSKYKFDYFRTLYDAAATRKQILKEFEWLAANVKETDNVFIYYSGHGDFKKQLNKGYWVPIDAKTTSVADFISNNDIQTFLNGIRSKHTLLVSDACFSGDIFRGKTVTVPFENSQKYYAKVHDLNSRKAISSGGIEPVMDGGRDGHSVFAYYLLKALEKNDNQFYDASQLFENIKIPVINNSDQSPNFNPVKNTGDEGGQFVFIKK